MGEPEDPTDPDDNDPLAFFDGAAQIMEVCTGYRTLAEAQGFAPAIAEQMAFQLHGHLLAGVFAKPGLTR